MVSVVVQEEEDLAALWISYGQFKKMDILELQHKSKVDNT